jgi:AraC-like DNA-binding protein
MLKLKDGFKGQRAIVIPKIIIDQLENEPLGSALHITDIGFFPAARNHFRERRQPINQHVLIYCVKGSGWYRLGSHRYEVYENDFFILPAGIPHSYGASQNSPWTIYWVHFKGALAGEYAKGLHTPTHINPAHNSRMSDRTAMFEEIFYTLNAGYSLDNINYAISLFHHYLGSLRYIPQFRNATSKNCLTHAADSRDIIDRAVEYMSENIEKRLSLHQISDYCGYTKTHFAALFKRYIGHAPIAYFNLLKIQCACNLLDTTTMRVAQIAAKLGFDDSFYFSRLFSKTMGVSPKEYRKAERN